MGAAAAYLPLVKSTLRERPARRLRVGGEVVSVRVRESTRAKTARIIVGPRRPLEVIVPAGLSDHEVDALLADRRGWVERKLHLAREIAARPPKLGLAERGV